MTIPFREHRLSREDYEFILVTRRFYPETVHVIVIALIVGVLTFFGGLNVGHSLTVSALIAGGVAIVSLGALPLLFLWRTGQLGVENYLLGNISSVQGHVNWPPIWQNTFVERALTFDWSEIAEVALRPAPWTQAANNFGLELNLRDGRQRILRVPNLLPNELSALADVIDSIASRRGFRFIHAPPLHPPL